MGLPADWQTVRVIARYVRRDGSAPSGTVKFSSPQILLANDTIILPVDVVAPLVAGAIDVQLAATDMPDVQPAGWAWTVEECIDGAPARRFAMAAPAAGGDIDLATVAPVVPPVVLGAFPMLLKGASGIEVLDALPTVPDSNAIYITMT